MSNNIAHIFARLIIYPVALLFGSIIAPMAHCQQSAQYITSSGNFIVKVANDAESAVPLQNVVVNYSDGPSFLHVPQSQGPIASIAVGAVTNFTFPYTIDSDAPDGTYTAHFTVVPQDTLNSESIDGSMVASVDFKRFYLVAVVGDGHNNVLNSLPRSRTHARALKETAKNRASTLSKTVAYPL